jgi:hypothetical protein
VHRITGDFVNRLLIVGILVISTMPLFALAARPDLAKLKAEAQNVVSIIKGDNAKTDVYCQINDLGEQIDGADQKKAEALSQQVIELEKKLGPESRAGRMTATWRYSPWRGRGRALAGCTPGAASLACTTKLPAHRSNRRLSSG